MGFLVESKSGLSSVYVDFQWNSLYLTTLTTRYSARNQGEATEVLEQIKCLCKWTGLPCRLTVAPFHTPDANGGFSKVDENWLHKWYEKRGWKLDSTAAPVMFRPYRRVFVP